MFDGFPDSSKLDALVDVNCVRARSKWSGGTCRMHCMHKLKSVCFASSACVVDLCLVTNYEQFLPEEHLGSSQLKVESTIKLLENCGEL